VKKFKVTAAATKIFTMVVEAKDYEEAEQLADQESMDMWRETHEDATWEICDSEEIEEDEEAVQA